MLHEFITECFLGTHSDTGRPIFYSPWFNTNLTFLLREDLTWALTATHNSLYLLLIFWEGGISWMSPIGGAVEALHQSRSALLKKALASLEKTRVPQDETVMCWLYCMIFLEAFTFIFFPNDNLSHRLGIASYYIQLTINQLHDKSKHLWFKDSALFLVNCFGHSSKIFVCKLRKIFTFPITLSQQQMAYTGTQHRSANDASVFLGVCICVCTCVCVCVNVCVSVRMFVCNMTLWSVCLCIYVWVCDICVIMWVCVMWGYVCMCANLCISMCGMGNCR